MDNSIKLFFALLRAGLWEQDFQHIKCENVNYADIYKISEAQSIVGLISAGLEHAVDLKTPQEWTLQFIGGSLQLERRNREMNQFIEGLVVGMRKQGIYTLLVKGQGIAQCYEKPQWRAAGDVDLYLSKDNYQLAKEFLIPKASLVDVEDKYMMHLGLNIDGWVVELHGTMYGEISRRMNKVLDEVHHDIFYGGAVRSWNNNGVQVFLPSADNDVIIVFTHFLQHFFIEGVGLRQICDWCRLLWTYRDNINLSNLKLRIKKAGLMTEWIAFASFAVDYLGMPADAMPFYDSRIKRKGGRILKRVMRSGNFGHNNDLNYLAKYKGLSYKLVATWRRLCDFATLIPVFPLDAPRFFFTYVFHKMK